MPCGTCGKRREREGTERRQTSSTTRPVYVVTDPDGNRQEFDRYIDASIHRRAVKGTMSTTTAQR